MSPASELPTPNSQLPSGVDELGRPSLAAADRARIREAFEGVRGRGALVWITHPVDKVTRGHVAAKIGDHWKIAAGGGFTWEGPKRGDGWFGVERTW